MKTVTETRVLRRNRRTGAQMPLHQAFAPKLVSLSDGVHSPGNRAVPPQGVMHFLGWKLLFGEAVRSYTAE
jgi:hypothetical protein